VPIHDQGYRRYAGSREALGRAWTVIASTGVRSFMGRRLFLLLLLVAWAPFVVRAGQMYAAANFPSASFLAVTARTFRDFLDMQGAFVFFVTIYVGAGLIANDRRANALQIYLSKPLTRFEYVAGKAATLAVFLLGVTWLPAMLLLVVQCLFAGSFTFLREHLFLLPAITVYAFLQVMLATLAMLALSSMSKSARFVGIMYTGLIFFTDSVFAMLKFLVKASGASLVSPTQSLAQLGDAIFRVPPRHDTPVWLSLAVIVLLLIGSVIVLERKVRGVEVVA
jgi:ABC-2 type transport system permease protein